MRALDDFGRAIVTSDSFNKSFIRFTRALRNEDIAGAPQVPWRLAQGSAGQKKFIPKRGLPIHQHNIEAMLEMKVLQSIVEQERIDFPFVDRHQPAFDAVFIDQHDDVLQIVRQHVGFVPGR